MKMKRLEICALLDIPQHIVVFFGGGDFLTLEDGTDSLSRNVGKELPRYAA